MQEINTIAYSILDLAAVTEHHGPADSFRNSLDLAQKAEDLGYKRFWLAEHHNMSNVASSATAVLIGHIAGGTSKIRVGSGGIMLPNHAPLIVAEQFGTLETLYPGRIDLGLGRAPGTDQLTARAIRGNNIQSAHDFPQDILKLQTYFSADNAYSQVRAIPGEGLAIPIYILGSSTESARLAAALGLPYAFASHFAPAQFSAAIQLYKQLFRPSSTLKKPYIIACVNVVAAETDAEANYLFTSVQQFFRGVVTGERQLLQPPVDDINAVWTAYEEESVSQMISCNFVGSPDTISSELKVFLEETGVNEIMATTAIYDHQTRLHSYQLLAEVFNKVINA